MTLPAFWRTAAPILRRLGELYEEHPDTVFLPRAALEEERELWESVVAGDYLWRSLPHLAHRRYEWIRAELDHAIAIEPMTRYAYTLAEVKRAVFVAALEALQNAVGRRDFDGLATEDLERLATELQREAARRRALERPVDVSEPWLADLAAHGRGSEIQGFLRQTSFETEGLLSFKFCDGSELAFVVHPSGCRRWREARSGDDLVEGPHAHQVPSRAVVDLEDEGPDAWGAWLRETRRRARRERAKNSPRPEPAGGPPAGPDSEDGPRGPQVDQRGEGDSPSGAGCDTPSPAGSPSGGDS